MARKPRHLSAEEEALWTTVAKTAAPMHDKKPRESKPDFLSPKPKKVPKPRAPDLLPRPPFTIGQARDDRPQTSVNLAPDVRDRVASAPITMDQKAFRKLSRGRLKPEGRIDLHGMTLAEAQPALIGFVLSSHAMGRRVLLVITGKGRSGRDSGGPIPEKRGILRDQVPRWLSSGPCKKIVMQVVQAHGSHGGGGAYYVYLRRNRN